MSQTYIKMYEKYVLTLVQYPHVNLLSVCWICAKRRVEVNMLNAET
jgi:hypothetical protein